MFRLIIVSLISLTLFSCMHRSEKETIDYGPLQVRDRIVEHNTSLASNYHQNVKPILENRCVVCHGCYDAPCQLKLSSPEGIDRGFSPELIFGTRFTEADPTRLFIDAQNTQQWRDKGYKNVLNERDQTATANLNESVLFQLLTLKESHPLPNTEILSEDDFDFSLNRQQTCPDMSSIDKYKKEQPLAGMPYGFSSLTTNEFKIIKEWLEQGAMMAQPAPITSSLQLRISEWEKVFNQKDKKSQLINRYIYEHLFLGHIYFSEEPISAEQAPVFFNLVRSKTPPGEPIEEIASRRPYDNPKVDNFYYRLRQYTASIVEKTHMPYALNSQRLTRWNELFYNGPFTVDSLPNYENGSNPFKNFAAIPAYSRYQFLLDEAEFTISGFIKGPVCRGNTALGVIQDKFWVLFYSPDALKSEWYSEYIAEQASNLELPSDYSSEHYALPSWIKYAKKEKRYIENIKAMLNKADQLNIEAGFDRLWSGNKNSSLTIFRHSDSAQVVKGLQGQPPKTAWVINYPVLERIHYLLVAGYDVFGSIRHQLITRLYMDFLRIESEMAFVTLLPRAERKKELDYWYTGSNSDLKNYFKDNEFFFKAKNKVNYQTNNPKQELFNNLKERYKSDGKFNLDVTNGYFKGLNQLPNLAVQQLPQTSFIIVEDVQKGTELYSLLRHNERTNVSTLLKEEKTRLPAQDKAEIYKGLQSSYPQVIYKITSQQQKDFVAELYSVKDAEQYSAFLKKFGIRRTNPEFWKVSDFLHATYKKQQPIQYGLFDYNRMENR